MSTQSYSFEGLDGEAEIQFDRHLHLPPDSASESLAGYDGIQAARSWQAANILNPDIPYRLLVPGAGVGTLACAFVAYEDRYKVLGSRTVEIDNFDIDHSAASFAKRNFDRYYSPRYKARFYQADWNERSTWDALPENSYQLILFNLPYLPREELDWVADDYANVPASTLDGGADGLEHFRTVLPQLPKLIDKEHGGTVLFRFQTPGGATLMGSNILWPKLLVNMARRGQAAYFRLKVRRALSRTL